MLFEKTSLILVESPFQLLCAVEYINSHSKVNYRIIFLETSSKNNTNQFNHLVGLLQLDEFEAIVGLDVVKRKSIFFYLAKLILKARKYKQSQYKDIIIGDYRSIYVRIIESRMKQNCIVLDDGIALLSSYSKIAQMEIALISERYTSKLLSNLIKKVNKNYSLYSMIPEIYFNTLNESAKALTVEVNDFKYLNAFFSRKRDSVLDNDVIVIGNPVTELKMISEGVFNRCILMLRNKYVDKNIVYIAHRRDSVNKLFKLEHDLKVEVRQFNSPLEIELISGNLNANIFYTFSSAALYTVSLLRTSSKCYYFKLNSSLIAKKHLKSFKNIYKLLGYRAKGVLIEK